MKKDHLLSVLLLLVMGSVASMNVAAAPSKSADKNVVPSHKKNKSAQKTGKTGFVRQRQMSEKDIAECTRLIDKVTQTDKAIHKDMTLKAMDNAKIAPHLKKNADVQLFASDDPAAIAHLTGKATGPLVKKTYPRIATGQQIATVPKVVPKTAVSPGKPVPRLPPDKQLFAANPPTSHVTTPLTPSKAVVAKPAVVASHKPVVSKSTAASHPHIELFAPNTPDLNHLQGKSANLANISEPVSDDNSGKVKTKTKVHKKPKKSTHKSKKPVPATETGEKAKDSTNIKSQETTPAVKTGEKSEKPVTKATDSTTVSKEKPKKEN